MNSLCRQMQLPKLRPRQNVIHDVLIHTVGLLYSEGIFPQHFRFFLVQTLAQVIEILGPLHRNKNHQCQLKPTYVWHNFSHTTCVHKLKHLDVSKPGIRQCIYYMLFLQIGSYTYTYVSSGAISSLKSSRSHCR